MKMKKWPKMFVDAFGGEEEQKKALAEFQAFEDECRINGKQDPLVGSMSKKDYDEFMAEFALMRPMPNQPLKTAVK